MKKNLIKLLALLTTMLCLSGCAKKSTEVKDEPNVDHDAVVNINGNYRIFDTGRIDSFKRFHSNGLRYSVSVGDAAIYEKTPEIEAVINQINLMKHGEGAEFQKRVFFFGEDSLEDYAIGKILYIGAVSNSYELLNDKSEAASSLIIPNWQYIIYTCPDGSKSALELAREQMKLNLEK